jgi:alginate O-acetyltransferase complex protein AlgI
MIFFSYHFALFCVIFFGLYWSIPTALARRYVLLAACVMFFGYFAGPTGLLPIIVLATGTYFAGRSRNELACTAWIAVCASALIFYKYTFFLAASVVGSFDTALGAHAVDLAKIVLPAVPPLAISFFTFEFVHYLIEVRRGHRPIRSWLDFALFAVFWPTLVAGPIKRYQQYIPALGVGVHSVGSEDVYRGALRISIGIVKKFAADNLTGWIAYSETTYDVETVAMRWLFLALLGARIFLDFSGYSDIAIGFARMMGIRIPENFNWPYLALSVSDFWRRWHISLSTWIRDYIYIPLGGSRIGPFRRGINALIAMSLCGLWHGAAWNFALWGIYHGCGLIISTAAPRVLPKIPSELSGLRIVLPAWVLVRWIVTLLFVNFGWLLFFYPAGRAWTMFLLLFTPLQ